MVNPGLVKQLLQELEAEKGCPVELRADTPESKYCEDGEIFGLFSERGVIVKRVDSLDKKYLPDVELIEGKYESLAHLVRRIQELNALYDTPLKGNLAERVYLLVKEKTGAGDLVVNNLAMNFKEGMRGKHGRISADKVYKILDRAGLTYLKHNIVARPDGVYDDRTVGGSISVIDETKVADISLKLIE